MIDDAKVECDTGPINLKPTVMFQTRLFNFNIKNTGLGTVDYKWAVQNLDGTVDSIGPYTVSLQSNVDSVANQCARTSHLAFHMAIPRCCEHSTVFLPCNAICSSTSSVVKCIARAQQLLWCCGSVSFTPAASMPVKQQTDCAGASQVMPQCFC